MEEMNTVRKLCSVFTVSLVVLSTLLILGPISPVVDTAVAWTETGGGDHGGASWSPANATSIAGEHYNIDVFEIALGNEVFVQNWNGADFGNISIHANFIYINGTLNALEKGYSGGISGVGGSSSMGGQGGGSGMGPGGGSMGVWGGDSLPYGGGGGGGGGGGSYGGLGGFGGNGGRGSGTPGGNPGGGGTATAIYGSESGYTIEMGSGSGGGGGGGGSDMGSGSAGFFASAGGGSVLLNASINISVEGSISANGENGGQGGFGGMGPEGGGGGGGGGGGSGGGILIRGASVIIHGSLTANGGLGGLGAPGGGGSSQSGQNGASGGGGRIKIFYHILDNLGSTITVSGENDGTIYYEFLNSLPDAPTLISPSDKSVIDDPTPELIWDPVIDPDLDTVTYYIEVDDISGDFSSPIAFNSTMIGITSWVVDNPLSDGSYKWRVRANDSFNDSLWSTVWEFTVDTRTPTTDHTVLKQGWNLVSVPLEPQDESVESVLDSIKGKYDAVQWFDNLDINDPWKHNKLEKPFGGDLNHLNQSMGFWVHITSPGDTIFHFNGTRPMVNETITLFEGWNLIGYPSLDNKTRDVALNNINFGSDIDMIQAYNSTSENWEIISVSDIFELGRGYWIHSKVEKVWEVPL